MAGRAHRATEPLHAQTYFAPETEQQLTALGLRPGRMCYFAGRAAAMGQVSAAVVSATFYNFNPTLVRRSIPRAWELADPADIVAARLHATDASLRRLLGDEVVNSAEVAELADLTRAATEGCGVEGRPLYAAHAELDWPDLPHLVLWHAITLLREYRGDGHLMALAQAQLSGIEALVSHSATGRGFTAPAAQATRGWSEQDWQTANDHLRNRGLLADDGSLTADGVALRQRIEADTDALAVRPWQELGVERTRRVIELGKPLVRQVVAAGAFPADVFGRAGEGRSGEGR